MSAFDVISFIFYLFSDQHILPTGVDSSRSKRKPSSYCIVCDHRRKYKYSKLIYYRKFVDKYLLNRTVSMKSFDELPNWDDSTRKYRPQLELEFRKFTNGWNTWLYGHTKNTNQKSYGSAARVDSCKSNIIAANPNLKSKNDHNCLLPSKGFISTRKNQKVTNYQKANVFVTFSDSH